MIDLLESEQEESIFHMYLLEMASTPDEGSSKNSNEGFPMRDIQTHNFLLLPPLKVPAFWFWNSTRWRFEQ